MCGFSEMAGCSEVASTTTIMVTKSVGKPTGESRKIRKPLMEKRRRARINQSLNELKKILLDGNTNKKEGSRPAKLEKADILEMTVQHLQKLHQQQQQKQEEQQQKESSEEPAAIMDTLDRKLLLQEKKGMESYVPRNVKQEKQKFEQLQEKCDPVQWHGPSSTVPDASCRQSERITISVRQTQHNISSPVQRRYCERLESSSSPKFRAGFSECAKRARELLNRFDDIDPAVRERLSSHLSLCLESLENRNDVTSSCSSHQAADSTQTIPDYTEEVPVPVSMSTPVFIQSPTGLTLLPTKLPNGDLAFVIPADLKTNVTSYLSDHNLQNSRTKSNVQRAEENNSNVQEDVVWRPW